MPDELFTLAFGVAAAALHCGDADPAAFDGLGLDAVAADAVAVAPDVAVFVIILSVCKHERKANYIMYFLKTKTKQKDNDALANG